MIDALFNIYIVSVIACIAMVIPSVWFTVLVNYRLKQNQKISHFITGWLLTCAVAVLSLIPVFNTIAMFGMFKIIYNSLVNRKQKT